ncbi:MAG: STAS domain-containing protein [Solirubrobacterales bacterium]
MSRLARLSEEQSGELTIAAIEGEVDASNAAELGDGLRALLTNQSAILVVDLSETTYLDSAGLNLLFTLDGELSGRLQELRLAVPEGSPLGRTLSITGLDSTILTHATRDAALSPAIDAERAP